MDTPIEAKFFSVKEVAVMLGKCNKWVYQRKEKIPGYTRIAGAILFNREVFLSGLKPRR